MVVVVMALAEDTAAWKTAMADLVVVSEAVAVSVVVVVVVVVIVIVVVVKSRGCGRGRNISRVLDCSALCVTLQDVVSGLAVHCAWAEPH